MKGPRIKKAYETPLAGEWVQPVKRGYSMACCDCGLVHVMDFRVKNGRAQFRAWRNNRKTGAMRRVTVERIYDASGDYRDIRQVSDKSLKAIKKTVVKFKSALKRLADK